MKKDPDNCGNSDGEIESRSNEIVPPPPTYFHISRKKHKNKNS